MEDNDQLDGDSNFSDDAPEEQPINATRNKSAGRETGRSSGRKLSKKELKKQKEILKLLEKDQKEQEATPVEKMPQLPQTHIVHRVAREYNVENTKPNVIVLTGRPNMEAVKKMKEFRAKMKNDINSLRRPIF